MLSTHLSTDVTRRLADVNRSADTLIAKVVAGEHLYFFLLEVVADVNRCQQPATLIVCAYLHFFSSRSLLTSMHPLPAFPSLKKKLI
jgi:hypothetical protein